MTACVRVRLRSHDGVTIASLEATFGRVAQVPGRHLMTGSDDYLLRVPVGSPSDYERLMPTRLHAVEGIASIETNFAYGRVKRATVFPTVPSPQAFP